MRATLELATLRYYHATYDDADNVTPPRLCLSWASVTPQYNPSITQVHVGSECDVIMTLGQLKIS